MGTLTLARTRCRQPWIPPSREYYVVEEELQASAAYLAKRKPIASVTAQDRLVMRDLVLGAFLGPQNYREDDGSYVAPYTAENTRDRRPLDLSDDELRQRGAADMNRYKTRVHAAETRAKKKPSVPLGPLAFQDAHIIRAVSKLQPEHLHWIRYAYADSTDWDDESGAVVALWEAYVPTLGKVQAKTLKAAQGLAHLAVQNAKRFINSGKDLHHPYRLRELLGVSEANWDKHWAPRWRAMNEQVYAMDRAALGSLCRRLKGYQMVLTDRGL